MEYSKIDMTAYNIHLIKTKKFKTIGIRVSFNNELWRIIGVFDDVQTSETDKSVKNTLVKIRKAETLGSYSPSII